MQNLSRRKFLTIASLTGVAALGGIHLMGAMKNRSKTLTILHTNDTHSRLDPFPSNHPTFPGMGGYARRAAIVKKLRKDDPELLLLDAGDVFQGTPFYNMFHGEPELRLMSKMGYDAMVLGNHEFDMGLEVLKKVMANATFPMLAANYDFSETILDGKTKPYITLERNGIKIGIYGLGIDLTGLVGSDLFGNTKYLDPVEVAKETEDTLKKRHRCELIICLSHLGFDYDETRVSDVVIARNTEHTNIIIGGHTHTILDPAHIEQNAVNKPVIIGQTGSSGVSLGVMNVVFGEKEMDTIASGYTTKIF